jgi:hypothetical protein
MLARTNLPAMLSSRSCDPVRIGLRVSDITR